MRLKRFTQKYISDFAEVYFNNEIKRNYLKNIVNSDSFELFKIIVKSLYNDEDLDFYNIPFVIYKSKNNKVKITPFILYFDEKHCKILIYNLITTMCKFNELDMITIQTIQNNINKNLDNMTDSEFDKQKLFKFREQISSYKLSQFTKYIENDLKLKNNPNYIGVVSFYMNK